ncbi:hypothetical protein ABG067_005340 [Albugo candida]|uniref:DNA replication complex GINS protein SLD5 n=1 Tax=Albugo candida TaxID=65357 RepID=A0A024GPQ5_9STRA|nr:unnamed protein product [Albugo candida]|eukprot:CCI48508.1 unnamed protein product [Albugo candida]
MGDQEATNDVNEDVEKMITLWRNELNAPDMLEYNNDLVAALLEQIKNQQEYIDSISDNRECLTEERSFTNKLYQMEIDRLRYMLASYLRTRLKKIEKYSQYIIKTPAYLDRLSEKERIYAQQHAALVATHLNNAALSKIPDEHQSLDSEGMASEPNLDEFVFCQSQGEVGQVRCDDRGAEFVQVREKDRHVIRYRSIDNFVKSNQIFLI